MRYRETGSIHDVSGMSAYAKNNQSDLFYCMSIMNTKLGDYILRMVNPTINLQVGNAAQFPILVLSENQSESVWPLVNECIKLTKSDWDKNDTSWNFSISPLTPNIAEHQKSPPTKLLIFFEFCDKYVPIQFRGLIFYGQLSKKR